MSEGDKLFISSKAEDLKAGQSKKDVVNDPSVYDSLNQFENWRQKLSNSWIFTSPLQIDGRSWASLQHYLDANKFDTDSGAYYNLSLDSGSELSKNPSMSRSLIQQTQYKGSEQTKESRLNKVSWFPVTWAAKQNKVYEKAYYYKFGNPSSNEEFREYQNILRATNQARLFRKDLNEVSMTELNRVRDKLISGNFNFNSAAFNTDFSEQFEAPKPVVQKLQRKYKDPKRPPVTNKELQYLRKIKRHELQMVKDRGYSLNNVEVYDLETLQSTLVQGLDKFTTVTVPMSSYQEFIDSNEVFESRNTMSSLYRNDEKALFVVYMASNQGKKISQKQVQFIQTFYEENSNVTNYALVLEKELSTAAEDMLVKLSKTLPVSLELFDENYFLWNPTRHAFAPLKTEIFSKGKEAEKFLKKEKLEYETAKLPRATIVDPQVTYRNIPRGSLVNSTRVSVVYPDTTDTFIRKVDNVVPKLQGKKSRG